MHFIHRKAAIILTAQNLVSGKQLPYISHIINGKMVSVSQCLSYQVLGEKEGK
jgi:hypothetical protein